MNEQEREIKHLRDLNANLKKDVAQLQLLNEELQRRLTAIQRILSTQFVASIPRRLDPIKDQLREIWRLASGNS